MKIDRNDSIIPASMMRKTQQYCFLNSLITKIMEKNNRNRML